MKLSVIIGNHSEAIKLMPVALGLRDHLFLRGHVCTLDRKSGQSRQLLASFGVEPDAELSGPETDAGPSGHLGQMLTSVDRYLAEERPDMVMVQGDSTSALAGALAAFYRQIPVAHVEAGLRTFERMSPCPKEGHRVMISDLAALHFAPTDDNKLHLMREGIAAHDIFVTGNTAIDGLQLASQKIQRDGLSFPELPEGLLFDEESQVVLVVCHQREQLLERLKPLCLAIRRLAMLFPRLSFVVVAPPHPEGRAFLDDAWRGELALPNVHLLAPQPYLSFVRLMMASSIILTDSGGIQEQAPSLNKPVLVMKASTARLEGVDAGSVRVVGTSADAIVAHAADVLFDPVIYDAMASADNPYGDGRATAQILDHCAGYLRACRGFEAPAPRADTLTSLDVLPGHLSLQA